MAGLSIQLMGAAARQYRPSRQMAEFQTEAYCRAWDFRNAAKLERFALTIEGPQAPAALALARLLREAAEPESPVPTSMATNLGRRDVADRVCGQAWAITDRLVEPAFFFTAIPRYGEVSLADLPGFDPSNIKGLFRTELNGGGALGSDGILFAVLEAEYQIRSGMWRFHWHGCASGGKLAALEQLRGLRAYRSPRRQAGGPKPDVAYRIKISRRPLFNSPKPHTYCIKLWRARWVRDDGSRSRRLRLPDEAAVQALLWQHRHTLANVSLVMGMRPGRHGFIPLNSTRMKGGDAQ